MKNIVFLIVISCLAVMPSSLDASPPQPCSCIFQSGASCPMYRVTYQAPDDGPCCYENANSGTINLFVKPCSSEIWYTAFYIDEQKINSNCNALCHI